MHRPKSCRNEILTSRNFFQDAAGRMKQGLRSTENPKNRTEFDPILFLVMLCRLKYFILAWNKQIPAFLIFPHPPKKIRAK